jgi:SPFH domain / Band 7 family
MLDDAFASKDDIASSVLSQLQHVMKDYGYEINNTLVTDLQPDARVKASMNEINAARRLKEAASHKAEADKTRQVKGAEAEAEARYLSGLGVARQRKAIVEVSRALCTFMLVCVALLSSSELCPSHHHQIPRAFLLPQRVYKVPCLNLALRSTEQRQKT